MGEIAMKTPISLTIDAPLFQQLHDHLFPGDFDEHGAVIADTPRPMAIEGSSVEENIEVGHGNVTSHAPTHEQIARRAYELYLERGQKPGDAREDWLIAENELADFFPKDVDGAAPIAYLWARTVRCESPNCGAEIPLTRSFWLSKKLQRRRALRHKVVRPAGEAPRIEFEVFEPKTEKEVPGGTVARARAT